jgi:hypothetical protein
LWETPIRGEDTKAADPKQKSVAKAERKRSKVYEDANEDEEDNMPILELKNFLESKATSKNGGQPRRKRSKLVAESPSESPSKSEEQDDC